MQGKITSIQIILNNNKFHGFFTKLPPIQTHISRCTIHCRKAVANSSWMTFLTTPSQLVLKLAYDSKRQASSNSLSKREKSPQGRDPAGYLHPLSHREPLDRSGGMDQALSQCRKQSWDKIMGLLFLKITRNLARAFLTYSALMVLPLGA